MFPVDVWESICGWVDDHTLLSIMLVHSFLDRLINKLILVLVVMYPVLLNSSKVFGSVTVPSKELHSSHQGEPQSLASFPAQLGAWRIPSARWHPSLLGLSPRELA